MSNEEPKKPRQLTDEQLRQLCIDIYGGLVFTDRHCHSAQEVGMVFMPIGLGGLNPEDEPEMIYEYMDKAGPRSVNGMPMFMSANVMNRADFRAWLPMYEKYIQMQEEFKDGTPTDAA